MPYVLQIISTWIVKTSTASLSSENLFGLFSVMCSHPLPPFQLALQRSVFNQRFVGDLQSSVLILPSPHWLTILQILADLAFAHLNFFLLNLASPLISDCTLPKLSNKVCNWRPHFFFFRGSQSRYLLSIVLLVY